MPEPTNQSPELCLDPQAFKRLKEKRHRHLFDYKVRSSVSSYIKFIFLPAGENTMCMKTQECPRIFSLYLMCSISVHQGIFKLVMCDKIYFIHVQLSVLIRKFKSFVVFTRYQNLNYYTIQK